MQLAHAKLKAIKNQVTTKNAAVWSIKMMKNEFAVALGKLGKGHKKTNLTRKERLRRSELAKRNIAKINAERISP